MTALDFELTRLQEGWGDVRSQSPMSPTRPPSMRKRQSMQFADMEQRLAMLVSENGLLQSAKAKADKRLEEQAADYSQQRQNYEESLQDHKAYVSQRDSTLAELNNILEGLRGQVAHLTEVNEELTNSRDLDDHEGNHEQWQQTVRELDDLRQQHSRLASDHTDIVRREVEAVREEKDFELQQLQEELEDAKEQVRTLQRKISASMSSEDIIDRDEDYFDEKCQELCRHLTSWVTRFSKLSDRKTCHLVATLADSESRDRFEDAILDGSEVDDYLKDRLKRRDVFMSITMSVMYEHVFKRSLFGLDKEQRDKVKSLQKVLQDIGPPSAVQKWRARTFTLLSKQSNFQNLRAEASSAVVGLIYDNLAAALRPPSASVADIQASLARIVDLAVDLSIEMRTQRAEYMMLPPPEPQYDLNGDLKEKLFFHAQSMNDRSNAQISNEDLEEEGAVVRMVLFPLVVKVEDDDEKVVVCPAQVIAAPLSRGKTVRVMSAQGGRSETSVAETEDLNMGGMF